MVLIGVTPVVVLAQEDDQLPTPTSEPKELSLITPYPAVVVALGESVDIDLELSGGKTPQTVYLEMQEMPDGWNATFKGRGKVIQAVYVDPYADEITVNLKLDPPDGEQSGSYQFIVLARGNTKDVELPIDVEIKDKLPARLSLDVELPTIKGSPNTAFRYDVDLKNEGDEEMTVNLLADAPNGFMVSIQTGGKEVSILPLGANETKRITIDVQAITDVEAGSYPFDVYAQSSEAEACLSLTAEVTGQAALSITAPDGRLSGKAYAGRETPLKVIIRNTGSSSALAVELSSSGEPSGWSVEFDPKQVGEIPAGEQVEVTANIKPADKAVAGDYMLTLRAKPTDGSVESAEFRITVTTSTLWGIVGVVLIAVAVGVVALAVLRFGRR